MKHTGCLHFITLMNLLYLPTSVNCPQDIISHIQVVHRLQVKSMHSLIRVWFLNPFRLPSSQCEAYSDLSETQKTDKDGFMEASEGEVPFD